MTADCTITGCALTVNGRWVSGDLFEMGSMYIFNGNYDHTTAQPCWGTGEPFYRKHVDPGVSYFEKRGVFIFRKDEALLNKDAKEYIHG